MRDISLAYCAWAGRMQALEGWRAYAASSACGVLLTLAMPPVFLLPLIIPAFSGLVLLLHAAPSVREAFFRAWWFGMGYLVTGLYWITIALSGDAWQYLWLVPIALFLLPAYLSLYIGFAGMVYRHFHLPGWRGVIVLAVAWVAGEYARSYIMTGFPWILAGYVWTLHPLTLQPAAWVGIYGLSLWTVILGGVWAFGERKPIGICVTLLIALFAMGEWRLAGAPILGSAGAEGVKVRLVQGNIPQKQKWDPQYQWEAVQEHIRLSQTDDPAVRYVVWPETAMPFPFLDRSRWSSYLSGQVAHDGRVLVTGVVHSQGVNADWKVWNSLKVVGDGGQVLAHYNKTKLVPGGEFLPLRWLFNMFGLDKVTYGETDFSEGNGPHLLTIDGVPAGAFQPLVCYEVIFPFFRPQEPSHPRPRWLLNITNDAWFGRSSGPYQHLHMAQMRAVEQGVPLFRAANSGISAAFDAYGRELGHIPLNQRGTLDVPIPDNTPPTWYVMHGEFTLMLIYYLLLLGSFRRKVAK